MKWMLLALMTVVLAACSGESLLIESGVVNAACIQTSSGVVWIRWRCECDISIQACTYRRPRPTHKSRKQGTSERKYSYIHSSRLIDALGPQCLVLGLVNIVADACLRLCGIGVTDTARAV